MLARTPTGCARVWQFEVKACCISCRSLSGNGKEASRRVWCIVGIGVRLLRHEGEVEGVVVKDDSVLELCAACAEGLNVGSKGANSLLNVSFKF